MPVAEVHVRAWQHAYRGRMPDEYLDALRPEDRAREYTFGRSTGEGPETIVALEHDVVRGFAATGPAEGGADRGLGELLAIYVDPAAWGRGIGRCLIADARTRLAERGFHQAILWVLRGNERAERFYRADGWHCDGGTRQEVVWGTAVDEVRYRREL